LIRAGEIRFKKRLVLSELAGKVVAEGSVKVGLLELSPSENLGEGRWFRYVFGAIATDERRAAKTPSPLSPPVVSSRQPFWQGPPYFFKLRLLSAVGEG
jgi:hypothetical protein